LDNNGAGLMLAMGVPLCYFAWEGGRGRLRWGFLLLIPLLIHAVLMTYSRGAMVSLLAIVPLLWLRSRHRAWLSFAGLGLALLLPFLAGPEIRERFFSTGQYQQDDSAQSRLASWTAAWKIALDNPVMGVGVRNSNLFSFEYGADMEGRTIHNTYLQTAADMGFVGLGLYLLAVPAVWCSLRRARRAVAGRSGDEAQRIRAIASAVECSFAVFAVGGIFLSLDVFELPYLLLLIGAQLATAAVPAIVPRTARLAPRPAFAVS
jgi:probable O-glycosylation ligase (exosortase A-associated)